MNQELQTAEFYDEMNRVVEALLKGETNYTAIARDLGMPRKKVVQYLDEWRAVSSKRPDIQERAMEALSAMDLHYSMIIKAMWAVHDDTDDMRTRSTTLKAIADVEAKRQEALQKAGMFDDSGFADDLAAMEEKAEAIKNLLSEVARRYPETKRFIMEEIQRIFGTGPSVADENTVIAGEISGS